MIKQAYEAGVKDAMAKIGSLTEALSIDSHVRNDHSDEISEAGWRGAGKGARWGAALGGIPLGALAGLSHLDTQHPSSAIVAALLAGGLGAAGGAALGTPIGWAGGRIGKGKELFEAHLPKLEHKHPWENK